MNHTVLVLATLLWPVVAPSQNSPSAVAEKTGCQRPSQTILLTVEAASVLPLSNTDVLASVDKQPFAPVSNLQNASTAPLDFVLVVDSSSSATRSAFRSIALDEVPKFVAAVRSTGIAVRTAVVEFNAKARVVQGFTSDPIENSLKGLSSGGGSALHDAVVLATRLAQQSPASNRRTVLLVSDGEDNLSSATREEVVQAAIRATASVYALSLGEPPREYAPISGRGEKFLKDVSSQTGGKAYFPKNATQVAEVLRAIRSELEKQYFAEVAVPITKKSLHQVRFKTSDSHEAVRGASAIMCE